MQNFEDKSRLKQNKQKLSEPKSLYHNNQEQDYGVQVFLQIVSNWEY